MEAMVGSEYILAIDQGTSGTKTVIFDRHGKIIRKATVELKSYFPQAGFVEQHPQEIYQNVLNSLEVCLNGFSEKISCCGISNQRETLLLWDETGKPISPALVWQCKRSIEICERLKATGIEGEINKRTGLIIDPYFSGTKLIWLYENDSSVKRAIDEGKALFGTVDSWLLYKLTGGKKYCTDFTNACRTLFFNLDTLQWDEFLLKEFRLKGLQLPEIHPSSYTYGETNFERLLPYSIPIASMIGDSHAAAFAEGCFSSGTAKATLGTGSSILMNTASQKISSSLGMVTTICWSAQDRVDYALEGIIVTAGATIKWLRDQLELFAESKDTETMATSVEDNNDVYLIPAFSGLGAPHWKMNAKAAILNLTFDCTKNHIVRSALESIPYQIKDVIDAMEQDSGIRLKVLNVDGGITSNRFVLQFLADLLNTPVVNIGIEEASALGAACLAGLKIGIYENIAELEKLHRKSRTFEPAKDRDAINRWYKKWQASVRRVY